MEIAEIIEILGVDEKEVERYLELALERMDLLGDSITIKQIGRKTGLPSFGVVFRDQDGKEEWLSVTPDEILVWDSIGDARQDLFDIILPTVGYHLQRT